MKFPINRRRSRFGRVFERSVLHALDALERRTLLNSYVVTNVDDTGDGSLRDAITQANANPGLDFINFNIPGDGVHAITPGSALPAITSQVDIDGTTQPGYLDQPLIELDGSKAGNSIGLEFDVGENFVAGLDIHSFGYDGIVLSELGSADPIGDNTIEDNYIGTDPTGMLAEGNSEGIHLIYSPLNVISGNLISGNIQSGIFLADKFCTDNQIEGNEIGTDITGLKALGNGVNGVAIGAPLNRVASDGFASDNVVGGTTAAQRNIISGNGDAGVWIEGGSENTVEGNYIGLGIDGTTPLGNGTNDASAPTQYSTDGVFIDGGSDNLIGGVVDGSGNVISANVGDGIRVDALDFVGISADVNRIEGNFIGTDKNQQGSKTLGNANGVEVRNDSTSTNYGVFGTFIGAADNDDGQTDGVVKGANVISGNRGNGIVVAGEVSTTTIIGNEIGTDSSGEIMESNQGYGISVSAFAGQTIGPSVTIIGNDSPLAGNVVSGNNSDGINVDVATGVTIEENYIGTDKGGAKSIRNKGAGIGVYGSSNVHIGGTEIVDAVEYTLGNVISGNTGDGIDVGESSTSVTIAANDIGTDDGGNNPIKNSGSGIDISSSTFVTVGGTTVASENIISGNLGQGILIEGQSSSDNHVIGNYIGIAADGQTAMGNGINGVVIQDAGTNYVGGTDDGDGNLIDDNTNAGVLILGSNAVLNAVYGNYIGITLNGDKASNAYGVEVADSAFANYIGNGTDAATNVIGDNTSAGVYLTGNSGGTVVSDDQIGCLLLTDAPALPCPNQDYGIEIVDSSLNTIGNFGAAKGNFIESTTSDPNNHNTGYGIFISGAASTGNQVQYNNIGANENDGIDITNGASGNFIGGTVGAGANIIDGNGDFGISINAQAHDNQVTANDIGTNANGTIKATLGNQGGGIDLDSTSKDVVNYNAVYSNVDFGLFVSASSGNSFLGNYIVDNSGDGVDLSFSANSNTVGGANQGDANLIDDNTGVGISIDLNSAGNQVIGNDIGADENGDYADELGNTEEGVVISDAVNNTIQGNNIRDNSTGVLIEFADTQENSVVGNVITNNTGDGVQITNSAYQNTVGGVAVADRNVLSQNGTAGVEILNLSHNNTIAGNYIGTDENGQFINGDGNSLAGIGIDNSNNNIIQSNVIRGNATGIGVIDNAAGNSLLANIITNGSVAGIVIKSGASNNIIGGSDPDDGNLIGTDDNGEFAAVDGNSGPGVEIKDATDTTVQNNDIRGNTVGVSIQNADSQGNTVVANDITNSSDNGVEIINGATGNTIGGTNPADGNLISLNATVGVEISNLSNDNDVIGNDIGTDENGQFASGDGNLFSGIGIDGSNDNTIQDNTIRGNTVGIGIIDNATGNDLLGNTITNSTSHGINIKSGSNNLIGDSTDGDGNSISLNAGAGIYIAAGTGNAILHNDIFGNGALGIDLAPAGVTPNDPQDDLDADTGPNNLQNFPVLYVATTGGSQRIVGTLSSAPDTTYTLEFFNLDNADASGYGQGDRFITDTTVTTNSSGVATFDLPLPANIAEGTFISGTATDPDGNTSEFSNAVMVQEDTDGDGIPDDMEDNAPNGGDSNNDGIPDSQQPNVTSFIDPVSGQYITLQSPAGTTLSDVTAIANPSPADAPDASFDQGLFSFTVNGVTPGGAVNVEEILPADSMPTGYFRYSPVPWDTNPEWYEWSYDGQTGAEINGNQITLHFIDGQFGDDDMTANGTIVDPGGPAFPLAFTVTNTNDSGPGSLRQAILDSNNSPGSTFTNLINFDIPGGGVQTIEPLSPLPEIFGAAVDIDATTQPGYAGKPIIELDGELSGGTGFVVGSSNTTIRGFVISGYANGSAIGLYQGTYYGAYDFDIAGNYLGTDITGTIAEPNLYGIGVFGGSGTIGGSSVADRNVISGNSGDGIFIYRDYFVTIDGNYIGVAADGTTPLGNGNDGIYLGFVSGDPYRAESVSVGGLDAGDGNVIAYNQYDGIEDFSNELDYNGGRSQTYAGQNVFLSNSIYGNVRLGISENYSKEYLRGYNDTDDGQDINEENPSADGISNPLNYPVLNSALSEDGQITITGHIDTQPYQTLTLQFFSSNQGTTTDFGQGQTLIGTATETTDGNGHVDFSETFDTAVPDGQFISATSSIEGWGTSDFSQRIISGDLLPSVFVVNTTDDTDDGAYNPAHVSLRDAILAANSHPGLDTIEFDIPGSGVKTITPLTALPPITDSVIIDGTTQPGYSGMPLIQIDGSHVEQSDISGAPVILNGLYLLTSDSTIKGLDIVNFARYFYSSVGTPALGAGIYISGDDNVVQNCFIGCDPTGAIAMPNAVGMYVLGSGNQIGGTTAADRNLISGNWLDGLLLANFDTNTDTFLPNGAINLIEGNFVGTDITGTQPLGNGSPDNTNYVAEGVQINGPAIVGGTTPGAGNVISDNGNTGLVISDGVLAEGNFIGTDVTGTRKLGNFGFGLYSSSDYNGLSNTIGGSAPGAGNIVSNNTVGGIVDYGYFDVIQGNLIGTDITGTLSFGNGSSIYDPTYGDGAALKIGGDDDLIGGPLPGDGNLISGNIDDGIYVGQATIPIFTTDVIQGNRIGVQADGVSPLGNGSDGIRVESGNSSYTTFLPPAGENVIGGADPGDGNTIAFNGRDGIDIAWFGGNPVTEHIGILSNLIFSNGSLGIDLNDNGVTPNDPQDVDTGPNDLQNFPVLSTVVTDGIHTTVTGTLNSTPNTYYQLQFFSNTAADPSGYGEGQTLLGTRQVHTDASGNATFTVTFAVGVTTGEYLTATATDANNNDTSEFSASLVFISGTTAGNQPPSADAGGPYTINEGDSLKLNGSNSSDPDGDPLSYSWDINGDGIFGDATGVAPTLTWAQFNALGIVNGPSSFQVAVQVDDGEGHVVDSSTTLTVNNVAPIVSAGSDQYVNEEDTVSLVGTFSDPGTADTHTFLWHVDADNGQVIADGTDQNFSFVPDDNGTYTVTFSVTDSDGGVGSAVVHVYVSDVPPDVSIQGVPSQGTVGVPIDLTSDVSDVSPIDTAAGFQYFWYAIGQSNNDYFTGNSPTFSFTPTGAGTYYIELDAQDKDGDYGYDETYLTVVDNSGGGSDTAPSVALGADSTINEGDTYKSTGSFTDPDAGDSWTATVNYGDGSGDQTLALKNDKTFDLSHLFAVHGKFDVSVTVTDASGLSDTETTHVTVNNVAPAVKLGTPTPVTIGTPFTLGGSFTDPGDNTWTATVDYGDNSGVQSLTLAADKTFTLTHTYQSANTFKITVTVTDDDSGVGTATTSAVVNKLGTSLSAAAASATYGGDTTLSATLTSSTVGVANKTITFKLNGVVVGTQITDINGIATLSDVSIGLLSAGSAGISTSFATDDTYVAATATATLTIGKAALSVIVDSKNRVYGQDNPVLTGTVSGLKNSDNITAAYSTTAVKTSPVNSYPITATLLDPSGRLSNYNLTITNSTLAVLATTLIAAGVNINTPEGTSFSGVVATFTTNNPIAAAADFSATIHWGNGQTSAGTVVGAPGGGFDVDGKITYADHGLYPISISIQDNAGQGVASPTAQASVTDVAPIVSLAVPAPFTVGVPFTLAGSFTDPGANTWTATVSYGDGSGDLPLTLAADKTFTLSHTYQSASSFKISVTVNDDDGGTDTATTTVAPVGSKLQTSLNAASASATYGGKTTLSATLTAGGKPLSGKTLVFKLNGIVVGSAISGSNGIATLSNVSIGTLGAGSAKISVSFAGDGQDLASTGTASLSIAKAPLVITVKSFSRLQGAANPALTGVVTGLLASDDITVTYSTTATTSSAVGTYPITAAIHDPKGRLGNYSVSITNGKLTITAKAPLAKNDTATTTPSTAVVINVLANDSDPAGSKLTLSSIVSGPGNGTAVIVNGKIIYTPNTLFDGTDSFTYKITNAFGLAATATVTVTVGSGAGVGKDPDNSSLTDLVIFGTPNNDTITVEYGGAQGKAVVIMNGKNLGTFNFTGRIFVYALGDNDTITIDPRITRSAFLYGGDGNDTLKSGSGNDILLGGAGNDVLDAGSGRDIMIGGLGRDTLNAGSGDDLMTGGSTIYDNNFKALDADLKEWSRTDLTYAQRAKDIQTGAGFAVSFLWNSSTVTSGAIPADFLNGGTGMDMFYFDPTLINGVGDVVTHFKAGEIEVDVHG